MHSAIQHFDKRVYDLRPNPGKTLSQRIGAQQQRCAYFRFFEQLSDPARMTAQEVYLQLFDLLVRDADVAKLAETSSDSVDDLIFFQGAANYAAAVHDALTGLAWKHYGFEIPCHARDRVEREGISIDHYCVHHTTAQNETTDEHR